MSKDKLMVNALLRDVGNEIGNGPSEVSKDEKKKWYPSESFTTKQIPELKGLKVGSKVTLIVEALVKGFSLNDDGKEQKDNYQLEFQRVGIEEGEPKGETKTDKGSKEKEPSPNEELLRTEPVDKVRTFERNVGSV